MKNLLWIAIVIATLQSCTQEKTAFINNTKVVSEFKDMKVAEAKWTRKNDELRKELEKKALEFQSEVKEFELTSKSLSKAKYEEAASVLRFKQQNLQRVQQGKVKEIQEESGAEIDSIVEKVKKLIKEYGKNNGYTYIYGDTEASNILYGKEELDITDEVIKVLNGSTAKTVEKVVEKIEEKAIPVTEEDTTGARIAE